MMRETQVGCPVRTVVTDETGVGHFEGRFYPPIELLVVLFQVIVVPHKCAVEPNSLPFIIKRPDVIVVKLCFDLIRTRQCIVSRSRFKATLSDKNRMETLSTTATQ